MNEAFVHNRCEQNRCRADLVLHVPTPLLISPR
jgi:hypothetical protein